MGLLARVKAYRENENSVSPPVTPHSIGLLARARKILEEREKTGEEAFEEVVFEDAGVDGSAAPPERPEIQEISIETRDNEVSDFVPRPVEILPQVLAGIGSIGSGIDAPYLVFGILADLLGLKSAVLLLPDHADDTLVPFCSRNIDFDTLSRMRIDADSLRRFPAGPLLVRSEEIDLIRPYFSVRSADSIERIALIPFGRIDDGLLIITKSKLLDLPGDSFEIMASTLKDALAKMIQNSRTAILRNISPVFILSNQEFPGKINQAMNYEDSLLLGLPKVQLHSIIESAAPGIWKRSLERDCLRVFGSIVQDDGSVSMDSDYYYLLFDHIDDLDVNLICEQLEFALRQAFSTPLPGLDFIEFSSQEKKSLAMRYAG
jgi:hypothetical protein